MDKSQSRLLRQPSQRTESESAPECDLQCTQTAKQKQEQPPNQKSDDSPRKQECSQHNDEAIEITVCGIVPLSVSTTAHRTIDCGFDTTTVNRKNMNTTPRQSKEVEKL